MTTANGHIFSADFAIRRPHDSASWTIPLLCVGICIIACCVLLPAADDNRRTLIETQRLQADLDQIKQQTAVNDQFLKSVADDPTLLERLAARQMKMVREGESVLTLKGATKKSEMSPFTLLNLPAPAPTPQYQPVGGLLGRLIEKPRARLFTMGGALLLMATGLVVGANATPQERELSLADAGRSCCSKSGALAGHPS